MHFPWGREVPCAYLRMENDMAESLSSSWGMSFPFRPSGSSTSSYGAGTSSAALAGHSCRCETAPPHDSCRARFRDVVMLPAGDSGILFRAGMTLVSCTGRRLRLRLCLRSSGVAGAVRQRVFPMTPPRALKHDVSQHIVQLRVRMLCRETCNAKDSLCCLVEACCTGEATG